MSVERLRRNGGVRKTYVENSDNDDDDALQADANDNDSQQSDVDSLATDSDDDELEYERSHTLIMEPEMLPSGRPSVDKILACRVIPPGWIPASAEAAALVNATAFASTAPSADTVQITTLTAPSDQSGASVSRVVDIIRSDDDVNDAHTSEASKKSKKRKASDLSSSPSPSPQPTLSVRFPSLSVHNALLIETSELLMSYTGHHFLCTFKHMSLLHTAWLPLWSLMEEGVKMKIKVLRFIRSELVLLEGEDDEQEEELIDSDSVLVDKILAVREGRRRADIDGIRMWWPQQTHTKARHKHDLQHATNSTSSSSSSSALYANDTHEYLVKWSTLPYSSSTWERQADFQDSLKIQQFITHSLPPTPQQVQLRLHPVRPASSAWSKLSDSSEYKNGNLLRPWQVEGVSWLLYSWYNRKGSILADEMGLGKTVQIVTTLQHISRCYVTGPFLVIVPLSTIQHWKREFELWTDMNVVLLQGSKHDRDMIREYEWYYRDEQGNEQWHDQLYKFNVCIATYESILAETALLSRVRWAVTSVDEAHRLKNKESKLFKVLSQFHSEHRILLTGTPIQKQHRGAVDAASLHRPQILRLSARLPSRLWQPAEHGAGDRPAAATVAILAAAYEGGRGQEAATQGGDHHRGGADNAAEAILSSSVGTQSHVAEPRCEGQQCAEAAQCRHAAEENLFSSIFNGGGGGEGVRREERGGEAASTDQTAVAS